MMTEAFALKLLVTAAVVACAAGVASAAAVTLQQGLKGYAGCSTRTIEAGRPAEEAPKGIFPLRGSKYAFHVRFDLPGDVGTKRLARAVLSVHLPSARKPNSFTEIFCHEVVTGGRQPSCDEVTDYDNGRRAGAVDSVELFSPEAGPGWQVYPFLPLGVPKGGKWIHFNITPLVAKWAEGVSANHGVMLIPTDRPDGRHKSTWEIDVPAADHKDAKLRPRLELEFAQPDREVLVGMTDSLRRVCDRSTRYEYRGGYETGYKLSMAANESEGFQVVVYPMLADLANVRLTCTDLISEDGGKIPAADVEYFVQDWHKLLRNWMTGSVFFGGKLYEVTDPLIPARPVPAGRHVHTPFYVRVRTRPDTPPGLYEGKITVRADKARPVELSLEVKVWPYAVPQKWNFHTMGQYIWDNAARFHGKDWNKALQRKYYDFLLEHRFSPVEQYTQRLSPRTDMEYCLQRGMNTIYLYTVHAGKDQPTRSLMDRIRPDYEKVRKIQALDHALVYIGDETDKWKRMQDLADLVHAHLPGALVMIGGSFPRKELTGYIDIYDPQIAGGSKVYSLQQDAAHLIAESQKRGEEFYWYVAAGPAYPWPNVQVEYPVIDSRLLFWMTWKYGVTGFEYYCYNIWQRNYADDPAGRFPNVRWKADGWSRGWPTNGDGMLFYPGPISSLRFEAIRDGIEDWESLLVLRDCVEAVRSRKRASRHKALIAKAEKILAVKPEIVAGFKQFTRDPHVLMAGREEVGELIAKFMRVVGDLTERWDAGQYTLAKAAEVRVARQTALRRTMLRQRHLKACEALGADPLPQETWNELWPKRVLFSQDFEGDGDWDGKIVTDGTPKPGKRALAAVAAEKWFARRIRVGINWDHARASTTTWVTFKYRINKQVPLTVFVFDLTQRDNWAYQIEEPAVGKWTQATLNVTEQFRKKSGGSARVRLGDALDDVFFFAGKPGEKGLNLLVDDVRLIGRD